MGKARTKPRKNPKKASALPERGVAKSTFHRGDGAGHLDPEHAARLLDLSRETVDDSVDRGFVSDPLTRDAVAQEFGESAVSAMTSGEDAITEDLDEKVAEEDGGPFIETSAAEEFASGTDESNIAGATREPFPKTSRGRG